MQYLGARGAVVAAFVMANLSVASLAQDSDFWSDSRESTNEPSAAASDEEAKEADGFWSDSGQASSRSSAEGGFWDSSSSQEVQRRRNQVLTERRAAERRRQAALERERERRNEETRRRWAREAEQARLAEAERRRRSTQTYNRLMGVRNAVMSGTNSSQRSSGGLSPAERAFMNRQRSRNAANRSSDDLYLTRREAEQPRSQPTSQARPAAKPFMTACFVNGQTISLTPSECARRQGRGPGAQKLDCWGEPVGSTPPPKPGDAPRACPE